MEKSNVRETEEKVVAYKNTSTKNKSIYIKNNSAITLIALVITIVVLLILAGVSITTLIGENGIITKASEAKIMTALGAIKEEIELDRTDNMLDNKNITVEQLLADGKIKRTVQAEGENYYMYYAIKPGAYQGMQELGKGNAATLKDIFLIDDKFNVKYIDKSGKEYGDDIEEKILEDETEIRFSSKAFSDYVSRISGVTETEMKFKWMKNQTSLTITDSSIDSLEDLVFFPNLTNIKMDGLNLENLDGIENCPKLTKLDIRNSSIKDFSAMKFLTSLTEFWAVQIKDFVAEDIVENLRSQNLKVFTLATSNIESMDFLSNLNNEVETIYLYNNKISKISGLNEKKKLKNLNLNNNRITKIENLSECTSLNYIVLGENKIEDITPLAENDNLTSINLTHNPLKSDRDLYTEEEIKKLDKIGEILDNGGKIFLDLSALKLFNNYTSISLNASNLENLTPLKGLTKLKSLALISNKLTLEDEESQNILKSMKNLETLNLRNNCVTNITAINNLTNLKQLCLEGKENNINLVEIEDIISNLTILTVSTEDLKTILNCNIDKITKLSLAYSGLTEIPDLSKFTSLTNINLNSNAEIANFDEISKIASLTNLNLAFNNLHGRMIDFSKLTNLTNLNLSYNTLWTEDLENLKALKNNKNLTINLSNNSIIDASSLLVLDTSCRIILGNNVNLTQESKDALKARFGSNVTF